MSGGLAVKAPKTSCLGFLLDSAMGCETELLFLHDVWAVLTVTIPKPPKRIFLRVSFTSASILVWFVSVNLGQVSGC